MVAYQGCGRPVRGTGLPYRLATGWDASGIQSRSRTSTMRDCIDTYCYPSKKPAIAKTILKPFVYPEIKNGP